MALFLCYATISTSAQSLARSDKANLREVNALRSYNLEEGRLSTPEGTNALSGLPDGNEMLDIKLTGHITNSLGENLSGVSVQVKNSSIGTTTN